MTLRGYTALTVLTKYNEVKLESCSNIIEVKRLYFWYVRSMTDRITPVVPLFLNPLDVLEGPNVGDSL